MDSRKKVDEQSISSAKKVRFQEPIEKEIFNEENASLHADEKNFQKTFLSKKELQCIMLAECITKKSEYLRIELAYDFYPNTKIHLNFYSKFNKTQTSLDKQIKCVEKDILKIEKKEHIEQQKKLRANMKKVAQESALSNKSPFYFFRPHIKKNLHHTDDSPQSLKTP